MPHHYLDLISLFDGLFAISHNTRLVKGEDEPVYLPADKVTSYHRVVFAHGYFASALHEIAHWCIAGDARRMQEDYGYWYCADGRDEKQQKAFEEVEIKPQAIEWAFSVATKKDFQVSTDNLNGAEPNRQQFAEKVLAQVHCYLQNGFPPRAQIFIDALRQFFKTSNLSKSDFRISVEVPGNG